MRLAAGSERIVADSTTDPVAGRVKWAPAKSLWILSMTILALVLGPLTASPSAVALCLVTSAITLCFGHSVGIHRRLIHKSFDCPLWLERTCVYLGTLVGMAGPIGMVRIHDLRDWAQRQPACHDYSRHNAGFWRDAWWQLHCRLALDHPPEFRSEPRLARDRFYAVLEHTWMAQQVPWALLFFALGGINWLVWGIFVRVALCVTGHWLIGHFAHRRGTQAYVIDGVAAQGYNVRFAGLISMGESFHNNHHAYPESARMGLQPGQPDAGWLLIRVFRALGLAKNIRTPETLAQRAGLRAVTTSDEKRTALPVPFGESRA